MQFVDDAAWMLDLLTYPSLTLKIVDAVVIHPPAECWSCQKFVDVAGGSRAARTRTVELLASHLVEMVLLEHMLSTTATRLS